MAFHSLCALLKGWPYWGLALHNPDIPVGDMILEPILLAIPGQCVHVKMPRHSGEVCHGWICCSAAAGPHSHISERTTQQLIPGGTKGLLSRDCRSSPLPDSWCEKVTSSSYNGSDGNESGPVAYLSPWGSHLSHHCACELGSIGTSKTDAFSASQCHAHLAEFSLESRLPGANGSVPHGW